MSGRITEAATSTNNYFQKPLDFASNKIHQLKNIRLKDIALPVIIAGVALLAISNLPTASAQQIAVPLNAAPPNEPSFSSANIPEAQAKAKEALQSVCRYGYFFPTSDQERFKNMKNEICNSIVRGVICETNLKCYADLASDSVLDPGFQELANKEGGNGRWFWHSFGSVLGKSNEWSRLADGQKITSITACTDRDNQCVRMHPPIDQIPGQLTQASPLFVPALT